jgi:hypothetical protein
MDIHLNLFRLSDSLFFLFSWHRIALFLSLFSHRLILFLFLSLFSQRPGLFVFLVLVFSLAAIITFSRTSSCVTVRGGVAAPAVWPIQISYFVFRIKEGGKERKTCITYPRYLNIFLTACYI